VTMQLQSVCSQGWVNVFMALLYRRSRVPNAPAAHRPRARW
jgi:hypothetical protein